MKSLTTANFGLYFTKIAVLGTGKQPAEVSFTKGLNIISGASETGKSYIIECINYLLGGKDQPKPIKEAKGYQKIQAEIRTFDGQVFTLSRQFDDNTIYMSEGSFDEFGKNETINLSAKHSDNNDNLSAYLLSILKLKGKQLKTNKWNATKSISFRDLAKFCLITENKIIDPTSPIYDGFPQDATRNEALFKLLLTGEDDSNLDELENPEYGKARIKGKIDLVEGDIKSKNKLFAELSKRSEALTTDGINVQIQKLISLVEEAHKDIEEQERKRQNVRVELEHQKSILIQNQAIKKRFDILNDAYSSDLSRLEFINEGAFGIDQLKEINCPLCDSLINKKLLEPYSEKNDNFLDSVQAEFQKIQLKQKELLEAIKEKQASIEMTLQRTAVKQAEYDAIDKYISDKLKPVHTLHNEELQKFMKLNEDKAQANLLKKQVEDLKTSLAYLQKQLNEKQQSAPKKKMPQDIYAELSDEIKAVLASWGLPCTVYFDPTLNDIVINNERRGNSGKGYRAIYLSAFMIGVLEYCVKNDLKHPRFLVLDSPLTTYKGKDSGQNQTDEKIGEDIQNMFYESLANLPNIEKIQVIIVENKDPPADVAKRVNYTHFTKNVNVPRYGFYPIN